MGVPITEHRDFVCLYVQTHLSEKITVSEIAQACGLNACYLNACFRGQTGESVSAHIRRMKIAHAQTLLRGTDHSLAEICAMLGYFDQSHFSRAFKAVTGMTPGAYRASSAEPGFPAHSHTDNAGIG